MKADIHLAYALATALAYSSKLVDSHPEHAKTVAEVATILGAADETGTIIDGGVSEDDNDRVILHQAGIIKATVAAWIPPAIPQLEQARQMLEWAAKQSASTGRAPILVDSSATEGTRFCSALATALGNLARAAGALSAVYSALEPSRFKDYFDVDSLIRIAEASSSITKEITSFKLPDLSNPEL